MKEGLIKSAKFKSKSSKLQDLIIETLILIESLGVPLEDLGPRRLEMTALSFLALIGKKTNNQWKDVKDLSNGISLRTRQVIEILNKDYEEKISSGSYDDIRRKHLKLLVKAGIVVHSQPSTARNDSTRGYALNPIFKEIIIHFKTPQWNEVLKDYALNAKTLKEKLARNRNLTPVHIKMPQGISIDLTQGEHNLLQKSIIEKFLSLYGFGAEVLYIGDTTDKFLHRNDVELKKIKFFELLHAELPDILAYSKSKNWLYLIEAVHSSGPISEIRLLELKDLTKSCTAEIVYVTAFLDRATFRKFAKDIAWETEVWIAESPEHLIHFNGDKFLGPYLPT